MSRNSQATSAVIQGHPRPALGLSGLIYGGLDRQARSDVRIYPVYSLEEMLNEIGK